MAESWSTSSSQERKMDIDGECTDSHPADDFTESFPASVELKTEVPSAHSDSAPEESKTNTRAASAEKPFRVITYTPWSAEEDAALITYVSQHKNRDKKFRWVECQSYLYNTLKSERTARGCESRYVALVKKHKKPCVPVMRTFESQTEASFMPQEDHTWASLNETTSEEDLLLAYKAADIDLSREPSAQKVKSQTDELFLTMDENNSSNSTDQANALSSSSFLRSLLCPKQSSSLDESTDKMKDQVPTSSTNVLAKRYEFHRRDQEEGESVANYLDALRRIALCCNFKATFDEMLRDRLIFGLRNEETKQKLQTLPMSKLTFKLVRDIALDMEMKSSIQKVEDSYVKIAPKPLTFMKSINDNDKVKTLNLTRSGDNIILTITETDQTGKSVPIHKGYLSKQSGVGDGSQSYQSVPSDSNEQAAKSQVSTMRSLIDPAIVSKITGSKSAEGGSEESDNEGGIAGGSDGDDDDNNVKNIEEIKDLVGRDANNSYKKSLQADSSKTNKVDSAQSGSAVDDHIGYIKKSEAGSPSSINEEERREITSTKDFAFTKNGNKILLTVAETEEKDRNESEGNIKNEDDDDGQCDDFVDDDSDNIGMDFESYTSSAQKKESQDIAKALKKKHEAPAVSQEKPVPFKPITNPPFTPVLNPSVSHSILAGLLNPKSANQVVSNANAAAKVEDDNKIFLLLLPNSTNPDGTVTPTNNPGFANGTAQPGPEFQTNQGSVTSVTVSAGPGNETRQISEQITTFNIAEDWTNKGEDLVRQVYRKWASTGNLTISQATIPKTHPAYIPRRKRPYRALGPKPKTECELCHGHFFNMEKHMKNVHEGTTCPICNKSFQKVSNMNFHMRIHMENPKYKCAYCGKVFPNNAKLNNHERSHTGERPFPCTLCDKRFVLKYSLTLHMRHHTGDKKHLCNHCGKSYVNANALKKHMVLHSSLKPYKCHLCDKGFKTRTCLNIHIAMHENKRPFLCTYCGKRFNIKGVMNAHIKKVHIEGADKPEKEVVKKEKGPRKRRARGKPREKIHPCPECDRMFYTPSAVKRHMPMHTGEKPYKCHLCPKAFYKSQSLKDHISGHSGLRPHQCKYCEKNYSSSSSLRDHMRKHAEKTVPCPDCPQKFHRKNDMRKHYWFRHSNEKPFECEYCGMKWKTRSKLKVHMMIHTNEKPHVCPVCGKCFRLKYSLSIHLKLHAGVKDFKCGYCEKAFVTNKHLKLHMKVHMKENMVEVPDILPAQPFHIIPASMEEIDTQYVQIEFV